jgi:hypothetical protein
MGAIPARDIRGVEKIAVSKSNEIAITHGPYISLLGLSNDMSGDTSRFDLFRAGQEHSFSAVSYAGPHTLVAIDPSGQMIVIDTAANYNRRVPASKFDINPAGDATVTAEEGKQIEVSHHSGYSHTAPIGPVVGTYSASVPGKLCEAGYSSQTMLSSPNNSLVRLAG